MEGVSLSQKEVPEWLCNEFMKVFDATKCEGIQTKLFGRSFNLIDPRKREELTLMGTYNINVCPSVVGKLQD